MKRQAKCGGRSFDLPQCSERMNETSKPKTKQNKTKQKQEKKPKYIFFFDTPNVNHFILFISFLV